MNRKAIMLLPLLVACDQGPATQTPPPPPSAETMYDDHWTNVSPTNQGDSKLEPTAVRDGRGARRMTVDHLRRSIPRLFNGVTWETTRNNQQLNTFDALSRTLGEADYIQVTAPNNEPSALFAKFMDDMAAQVCQKAVIMDQSTPDESARVLIRHPEDPDANLRFLSLKLHSIYVPDADTQTLASYRGLYDGIVADTGQAQDGWLGVCMAMLTAPEFMAY